MVDGQLSPTNPEVAPEAKAAAPKEGQKAIAQDANKPGTQVAGANEAPGELTASGVDLNAGAHLYRESDMPFWTNAIRKFRNANLRSESPALGLLSLDETTGLPPQKLPEGKKPGTQIKDKEGRPLESVDSVPYDQEPRGGVSVTSYSRREDGTVESITTYTYDKEGNIYSSGTIYMNGEAQTERTETTKYSTDAQGHLTGSTTTVYDANGNSIGQNATTYEYDEKGNLVGETTSEMAADGTPLGSTKNTYSYDEEGNLLGVTHEEKDKNGNLTHVDRTDYDENGEVSQYSSTEYDGDRMYTTSFAKAKDGSGDIVRTDVVADNPPPENGTGIRQKSTTTMRADGTTTQFIENIDPMNGTVTSTETTDIRADGSVRVTTTFSYGGAPVETTYPPGTVQQFSETGKVQDGTRNLFLFGDGSIAQGLVNTTNLGLSAEVTPENKNMTALQRGIARLKGWAATSNNPEASIDSVLAAIGEFGRDGDDPKATRPNATEGVRLIGEIGRDAKNSKTSIKTADGTFTFAGDGSAIAGAHNIQHGIGDGDANIAIKRARQDGEDGTVQGGLVQYARFAPTMTEAIQTIVTAGGVGNRSFGAGRLAVSSLADADSPRTSKFAAGADNIERADDTPGDHSLKSGVNNLLEFGKGSLVTAGAFLRGCSEDGRVETGIANTRYASDDGKFFSGQKNMTDAGNGNPVKGYENFKSISDDGKTFQNGVDNARSVSDNNTVSTGIVNLQRLSPQADMAEGGRIVKLIGDGSFAQGAQNVRLLSDEHTFVGGSNMLQVLGGGNHERGAENLRIIGGGNATAGVTYLVEVGQGSAEQGIRKFETIGGGNADKGVQMAYEAGGGTGGGKDAVRTGLERFEKWGNGDVVAGAKYYEEHRAQLLVAIKAADFAKTLCAEALAATLKGAEMNRETLALKGSQLDREALIHLAESRAAVARSGSGLDPSGGAAFGFRTVERSGSDIPSGAASGVKPAVERTTDSDPTIRHLAVVPSARDGSVNANLFLASSSADRSRGMTDVTPAASASKVASELVRADLARSLSDGRVVAVGTLASHTSNSYAMKSGDSSSVIERAKQTFAAISAAQQQHHAGLFGTVSINVQPRVSDRVSVSLSAFSSAAATTHLSALHAAAAAASERDALAAATQNQSRRSLFGGSTASFAPGTIGGAEGLRMFTYRGSGGNEITIVRMADGRVMTVTRTIRGVRSGFTADAATISDSLIITRRPLFKGGDSVTSESQKSFSIRRARFIKRRLIGVEIALAILLTSSAIARHLEPQDTLPDTDSNTDRNRARRSYPVLTRPTWLVRKQDDLVRLATHLFHDPELGYLIADLNQSQTHDVYVDNKRIVELKERQRIELPVWQDIVEFHKHTPRGSADPACLITIITENHFDTDLINATLAPAMGATAAVSALARVAAR